MKLHNLNPFRLLLIAALAVALAGCEREPTTAILEGQLSLADDATVPEDATIQVRVFEDGEVVGQRVVLTEGLSAPFAFELAILPQDPAPWTLRGEMRDADGNLLMESLEPIPVPNQVGRHAVEVVLHPVAPEEEVVPDEPPEEPERPAIDPLNDEPEEPEVDPDEEINDQEDDEDYTS